MNVNYGNQGSALGHGYFTVYNGTVWYYDTSVSHQQLQEQNYRLTNMIMDYNYYLANTYVPHILQPVLIENDQFMKRQKVGHEMENQPSTRTVSAAPERVIPSDVLPYASSHNASCIKIEPKQGETV